MFSLFGCLLILFSQEMFSEIQLNTSSSSFYIFNKIKTENKQIKPPLRKPHFINMAYSCQDPETV